MKGIKAVVFDADGMMITGERPSLRLVRDYGVPKEKVDAFFDTEFKKCVVGKADLKEEVAPYLKTWGWKGSMEDFFDFWFAQSYKTDERLAEAVRKLRASGVMCFLATNQEKYRVLFMKQQMDFEALFDGVVSSADVGIRKPDRKFFDTLIALMPSIEKSEVLFWDDREENIEAARKYGFQAELYKSADGFFQFVDIKPE